MVPKVFIAAIGVGAGRGKAVTRAHTTRGVWSAVVRIDAHSPVANVEVREAVEATRLSSSTPMTSDANVRRFRNTKLEITSLQA